MCIVGILLKKGVGCKKDVAEGMKYFQVLFPYNHKMADCASECDCFRLADGSGYW
jgi:hypothetical protein